LDPIHREDPEDGKETDLDPLKSQVESLFRDPENRLVELGQVLNVDSGFLSLLHVQIPLIDETSEALFTDQRRLSSS
jgi:hypothetical protein